MRELNRGDFVKVRGFRGVACYIYGHAKLWEPYVAIVEDEDGNECEETTDEGEWIDDPERLLVIMVGDDRKHDVDVDDCEPMSTDEFCPECGQVGCCAYG